MDFNQTTPWVEKYRPKTFDTIVLEKYNKIFLENIIEHNSFPNLLLYVHLEQVKQLQSLI